MKSSAPVLLPLLRSRIQAEIIAWLVLHPEVATSLSDLAHRLGTSPATVTREVNRLSEAGLIIEERKGNLRLVRFNTATPLSRPLTDLMAVTFGVVPVLSEVLASVAEIQRAYVYGSWAARFAGSPGEVPRDIDVLVVGEADADDLDEAARLAERRLAREVNIRQIRPARWAAAETPDPFLASVLEQPRVQLDLGVPS